MRLKCFLNPFILKLLSFFKMLSTNVYVCVMHLRVYVIWCKHPTWNRLTSKHMLTASMADYGHPQGSSQSSSLDKSTLLSAVKPAHSRNGSTGSSRHSRQVREQL